MPGRVGRLSCDFNAVRNHHISAKEGDVVEIIDLDNGYAMIRRDDGKQGKIPNYFVEVMTDVSSDEETSKDVEMPEIMGSVSPIPEMATFKAVVPSEGTLFPGSLPYFIEELMGKSIRCGDTIELDAQIGSRHQFGMKWKYPDKGRETVVISAPSDNGHISLVMPNSTKHDSGHYTVSIANEFGKAVSSCWVIVVSQPSPPVELKFCVDPSKPRAIRLKWTPPHDKGGSRLLWYTVEYTKPEQSDYLEVIHGIKQCGIRISHLRHDVYTFRVFAFNEYFRSAPSESVTVDAKDLECMLEKAKLNEMSRKLGVQLIKASFAECFEVEHQIGRGRWSTCRQLRCKISGKTFAGKYLPLNDTELDKIGNEARTLARLRHPNVVGYFGTALCSEQVVLIMEKVPGLPILTFIIECGFLSEALMQKFTFDLLSALTYLHTKGIAHLGIKPEELLIETTPVKQPNLILIDFSSAEHFDGPDIMNTSHLSVWQGGSVEYLAPEQLAHRPTCKSDIWAVAVLLFVLATGVSPFEDPDGEDDVSRRRILEGEIAECSAKFREYKPDLLGFIAKAFVVEHKDRISATQAMSEPWISNPQSEELFMVDHIEDYCDKRRDRMRSSFLLHEV
uniref:Protein kinase domain-containing protein n=1 Tax=Panagrellus redivivus TaxID=6233 RepID=A0A7E4W3Z3_PANRE